MSKDILNVIMNVHVEAATTAILAIFALIVLTIVAFWIFVKDNDPHFSSAKMMIFGSAALMLFAGIFL